MITLVGADLAEEAPGRPLLQVLAHLRLAGVLALAVGQRRQDPLAGPAPWRAPAPAAHGGRSLAPTAVHPCALEGPGGGVTTQVGRDGWGPPPATISGQAHLKARFRKHDRKSRGASDGDLTVSAQTRRSP